jgi:hypothetical protein
MFADRVKETSTTTGTGTLNLGGAATGGFQTFVSGIGTGNQCYYSIQLTSANQWEVGIGTVTAGSPDTLSRDTVLASSNAAALVNFSAGTKDVWCNYPANNAEVSISTNNPPQKKSTIINSASSFVMPDLYDIANGLTLQINNNAVAETGAIQFYEQGSTPSNPPANTDLLYAQSGKPKIINSAGTVNNFYLNSIQSIATTGGTTTLNSNSPTINIFTGTLAQTVKLPDATTISAATPYQIKNNSTGVVTLQDGNAGALVVIPSGASVYCWLITAGTVAGVWDLDSIGFWSDPTTPTKQIVQSSSAATAGTVLTLSSQQATSQTLSYPNIRQAEDIAVKPTFVGSMGEVYSTSLFGSSTPLMMGYGQAGTPGTPTVLTPVTTGRVFVIFNTSGDGATLQIRYGTGTPPANGAPATGTAVGSSISIKFITGVLVIPCTLSIVVTGLTLGTQYWFDLAANYVTGGQGGTSGGMGIFLMEI